MISLNESQKKYLSTIPPDKIADVVPYDPSAEKLYSSILSRVKKAEIDLPVVLMGSAALKIAGIKELDISIMCSEKNFKKYAARLEKLFGHRKLGITLIKWEFNEHGFQVEIYLTDPNWPSTQEQIKVMKLLKSSPKLVKQYEDTKLNFTGQPFREYMKAKYEFFQSILENTIIDKT